MQTCEFLGKKLSVNENLNKGILPLKNESSNCAELGKELLSGYLAIAQKESWLSHAHKKRVQEFFENCLGMNMPSAEEFSTMKTEDMTLPNNTNLYTTVISNMVERAFRPTLVMNEVIRTITVNPKGMKELEIPISALKTAAALPTNGVLAEPSNDDYSDAKITLAWIYSYEVITTQLIQQGIIDIVQDQMFEVGDALARKVDLDIVAAFNTAAPDTNANSNYLLLDAAITYSDLVDGVMNAINNNAMPDAIVTNPLTWANFLKNSNVITALGYNSVDKGSLFPRIQDFLGLRVILTPQATSKNLYIVDTQRCKYLIEGSAIQMLDGRKSGTVNYEVIGLKLYGVKVIQPKAIFRLVETISAS